MFVDKEKLFKEFGAGCILIYFLFFIIFIDIYYCTCIIIYLLSFAQRQDDYHRGSRLRFESAEISLFIWWQRRKSEKWELNGSVNCCSQFGERRCWSSASWKEQTYPIWIMLSTYLYFCRQESIFIFCIFWEYILSRYIYLVRQARGASLTNSDECFFKRSVVYNFYAIFSKKKNLICPGLRLYNGNEINRTTTKFVFFLMKNEFAEITIESFFHYNANWNF